MTRTKPNKGGGKSSEEDALGVGGTGGSSASSPALPPVLAQALALALALALWFLTLTKAAAPL